ncbi:hypothetical protein ACWIID_13365 [Streptomyces phaeochromogenes]
MAEMMAGTGVSYSAMGLFSTADEDGDGRAVAQDDGTQDGEVVRHEGADGVAQCTLTVAAVPTDQDDADTDVVAQGILAILSGDEYNDARWLDLPCGPAEFCDLMAAVLRTVSFTDPTESAEGAEESQA